MNFKSLRIVLTAGAIVVLTVAAAWLAADYGSHAAAQEGDDAHTSSAEAPETAVSFTGLWLSSAEAPEAISPEQYSAPDTPLKSGPDIAPGAPDAVQEIISWRATGTSLKPREHDVSPGVSGSGGCAYASSGDAFTVWNLSPMLPQGAVVETLRMYYNDTSASNSSAWFTVYDLYGSIVEEWSVSSAGSAGNGFNDSAAIDHTVDYSTYSYLLNWRPVVTGSTMQLCGFRIFYTPPPFGLMFLPTVQHDS